MEDLIRLSIELEEGGAWLKASREWIQRNIKNGDIYCWNSDQMVSVPFYKFQELALEVAIATLAEERKIKEAKNE